MDSALVSADFDSDAPSSSTVAEAAAARLAAYATRAETAYDPETLRAIRNDTQSFTSWCLEHGHAALPASPTTVGLYVAALGVRCAVATVRRHVASVAHLHRAAGLADPTRDDAVRLALRGLARARGTRPRQAAPIGAGQVAAILATTRGDAPHALRDRALVLVARDLLARRSELVALDVADLAPAADGALTVLVRRSKTDQEGGGAVGWLAPRTARALRAWLAVAQITDGPVFRAIHRSGKVGRRLSAHAVSCIFKTLTERAGGDPARVSGHSARVGMAQDLVAAGAELPAVMQAGRWSSPAMPARYAERLVASRGAVARYYDRAGPADD